jgi:hypothetical protein
MIGRRITVKGHNGRARFYPLKEFLLCKRFCDGTAGSGDELDDAYIL